MTDVAIITETFPAARADGRNNRSTATKRDILAACRRLLMDGVFRPTMADCCQLARRSERSGFEHFQTIGGLLTEALRDGVVRNEIASRAVGPEVRFLTADACDRIVRAVVLGRG